jgi:hypothetical protein
MNISRSTRILIVGIQSQWFILTRFWGIQHQKILERPLPEALKQSIARKIENNLFSKASANPFP